MTAKAVLSTALALIAMVVTFAAIAAEPPTKVKKFDKWELRCGKPEANKAEHCFITQVQTLKDDGSRLVQATIGKLGPQGEFVIVTALPLGIFIPGGATLKIEGIAPIPLTLTQCTVVGCMAQTQLSHQTVVTMSEAKRLTIGVQPVGSTQPLDISLQPAGLKAAIAKIK